MKNWWKFVIAKFIIYAMFSHGIYRAWKYYIAWKCM